MKLIFIISTVFLLAACAPPANKDFFECGAGNTLVVCPVGESPDAATHGDCRAVGSGTTTIADGTCS